MAKRFGWLDREKNESVRGYDKRINELAAFHAGYAFLTWANYCEEYSAFAVYVVWNGECNAKLASPMPSGGFMMHCGRSEAEQLIALGHGLPVFIKLYSKLGFLHAEQLMLCDGEQVYDLYFNGCECVKPDGLCFTANAAPSYLLPVEEDRKPQSAAGSYRHGSYRAGSYVRGSYRRGSYVFGQLSRGSYLFGSFIRGSFRVGSLAASGSFGSFRYGSFSAAFGLSGSYLRRLMGGSYRYMLGGYGGSGLGGLYLGSYGGSFYRWGMGASSYVRGLIGSFYYTGLRRGSFINGSFYGGSYRLGSFTRSGFVELLDVSDTPGGADEAVSFGDFTLRRARRLTWELGYGLDLI